MSNEILVNVAVHETRVAQLENGVLQELYVERNNRRGVMNNIYMGKVARVMPGMEAVFVDIGLERAAFLHIADVPEAVIESDGEETSRKSISQMFQAGQQILVQVIKEPLGTKGARVTTHLTIASRYLVLMPNDPSIAVSVKIEDEAERERLRELMLAQSNNNERKHGYIVRTVADGANADEFLHDIKFLDKLWCVIQERMTSAATGTVVFEDFSLEKRVLRDMTGLMLDKIRVDRKDVFEAMRVFAQKYVPDCEHLLEMHDAIERPIFDLYGVEDEITRAMERKVGLKSGGYLIIDQTESMTTVDVNTGSFIGSRNLEDTSYRTNLEAAQALARQLRLRNLGGIIIIDFIDMSDEEHRRQVLRALEKGLEKDPARTKVFGVSELGLVQMTRKRTRESLEHMLCESCISCDGRGYLRTTETVSNEIYREILRLTRTYGADHIVVLASQSVVDFLLDEQRESWEALQEIENVSIKFQVEQLYYQDQYDVVMR